MRNAIRKPAVSMTRWAARRAFRVLPRRLLHHASALADLERWTREHPTPGFFATRHEFYAGIHASLGAGRLDYLEFGVAKGRSLRYWLELNRHPDSRFVGFDSFEGLPEVWDSNPVTSMPRGAFNQRGQPPRIDDPRVQFVKGWFQDTLSVFLDNFILTEPVVVHLDADLYSSTLYVLTALDRALPDGSVLIFDEFSCAAHEFRAFMDYMAAYRRGYRLLGVVGQYAKVAIRLEPVPEP